MHSNSCHIDAAAKEITPRTGNYRRLVRDTVVVSTCDGVAYASIFGVVVILNRFYGTAELGRYSMSVAVSSAAILSMNNGFSAILKRDVSVCPERAREYAGSFLVLRFALLVVIAGLLEAWAYHNWDTSTIVAIRWVLLARSLDACSEIFFGIYQATGHMAQYGIARATQQFVLSGTILIVALSRRPVEEIYHALALVSAGGFLINTLIAIRIAGGTPIFQIRLIRYAFSEAWPLLVNSFIAGFGGRSGTLIVAYFAGLYATGIFTAAANLTAGTGLLPAAAGMVLFPELCRTFASSPQRLWEFVHRCIRWLGLAGAAVSAILILLAGPIVHIYGKIPASTVSVLRILALASIGQFLQPVIGYLYTAARRQQEGMWLAAILFIFNVGLSAALTARFALTGAAISVVIYQTTSVGVAYAWLRRSMPIELFPLRDSHPEPESA